jgi:hypothetical protein
MVTPVAEVFSVTAGATEDVRIEVEIPEPPVSEIEKAWVNEEVTAIERLLESDVVRG